MTPALSCDECDSGLVYPLDIEMHGADTWQLELRCPECGWSGASVLPQDAIEELEQALDRGHAELEAELERLIRANMTDYLDRFASAMAADAIYPMDF